MRNFKIAKVYWRDPATYTSPQAIKWLIEKGNTTNFITVGHVLKMGKKDIILAHEISEEGDARHTSVIPRSIITKIEYLKAG